jgi:hypothetical protein
VTAAQREHANLSRFLVSFLIYDRLFLDCLVAEHVLNFFPQFVSRPVEQFEIARLHSRPRLGLGALSRIEMNAQKTGALDSAPN